MAIVIYIRGSGARVVTQGDVELVPLPDSQIAQSNAFVIASITASGAVPAQPGNDLIMPLSMVTAMGFV